MFSSLNFIRLLRVVITPSVTDSKQSDEFQATCFHECFIFCRVPYHWLFREWLWRIFFARRGTPEKNKTIIAILQSYPESHSEYYAPLDISLYSVPLRFRPSPLLYLPRGPGKLSSATVKQDDQANPINPEQLVLMILDNLVVLLLFSCLFWV